MRRQAPSQFVIYFVPALISIALVIMIYHQALLIAPAYHHNLETFSASIFELHPAWRPRLLSILLASRLTHWQSQINALDVQQQYVYSIGIWTAFWLAATNLLYVAALNRRSLFFLFGTYAGIAFGYMPGISVRIYPWDMPPLFFFTLFVILVHFDLYPWLMLVVPLATGFKETAIILSVAFLFWDSVSLQKRLTYLGITLLGSIAVKVGMALIVDNPSLFYTMIHRGPSGENLFLLNLKTLFQPEGTYPIWINAATLVGFLIIPSISSKNTLFKLVAFLFIGATFVYGIITEYRIWFEMIPLSLYGLYYFSTLDAYFDENRSVLT